MNINNFILVIEDNALFARMYKSILEAQGFRVRCVFDGEEALNWLATAQQMPDLVLLDLLMPKVNGYEVFERMKSKDNYKHIPIIVLTNMNEEGDMERVLKMGALMCLIKVNNTPKQIVEKVKEVFAEMVKKGNSI